MSMTRFVALPDVAARIKPLRPKLARTIPMPLRVEPRSTHYSLIGTVFDYLLRFELQRRAPYALVRPWIAEDAPDLIWQKTDTGGIVRGIEWLVDLRHENWVPPQEVAHRARRVIEEAKCAVAAYVKSKRPSKAIQAALAGHALRLAHLDSVIRALRLDPQFEVVDPEDVRDLLAMLALVPFDALLHKKMMRLNPTFGEASRLIGGADADLLTGDLLVDFKTTKENKIKARSLDQLLGYFFLARHQRRTDSQFPEINRLGLYFGRHGYLWILEASAWTQHPQFLEIEEWFVQRAKAISCSHPAS